jgi:membrane protein
MKKIIAFIIWIKNFLFVDIWQISHQGLTPVRSFFYKQIKIFLVTIRGFMENKVSLQASALTYYSIMSIVPLVAMIFGIAKGFGLDKLLQNELTSKFSGQQEVLNWIISFANSMLERTKGGIIAGVGLALLFWSVMNVLSNIESAFNNIWQVKKGRTLFRKFSDYLAIMLIAPVFIIASSSATIYITTQITTIVKSIALLGFFSPVIRVFINMIPYVLIWIVFSIIYILMPNTKVKIGPAVISGILAGTIFQIVQWIYVKFQISVSSYNAIYGSFAAIPLFMIWMQTAWLIVLFGAELSYASQNFAKYEYENEATQISPRYRKALSLLICSFIIKKFSNSEHAPGIDEISEKLQMPSRIVRTISNNLVDAGLISQVYRSDSLDVHYQPACDIGLLTIKAVLDRIDNAGISSLAIAGVPELKNITNKLDGFSEIIINSKFNILLKDVLIS